MDGSKASSEHTRSEILRAARELFAARGINEVTVRDIAAEAGVTHALVHRYFGTKEEMLAEILRREIQAVTALPTAPEMGNAEPLEVIRRMLLYGLTEARTTMLLVARAELAGLEPEKMLDHGQYRPLGLLAAWLNSQQTAAGVTGLAPDPALVSVVVGAVTFGLQTLGPWLMTSVGLQPEDLADRRREIIDILVDIVTHAAALPSGSDETANLPLPGC